MYSDAKLVFFGRISLVFVLAASAMATALSWESSRLFIGGLGGLVLFLASLLFEAIEKRRRYQAAAVQELFDTRVFQLDRNPLNSTRPTVASIAQAAARYKGKRDANWYDPVSEVERPFDILICQGTNLGWGATMHRLWAWILLASLTAGVVVIGVVWGVSELSIQDALLVLLIPALAPVKEVFNLVRGNLESSTSKEEAERAVSELWDRGMKNGAWAPSMNEIRSLQDRILSFRQTNAYVPDWLDSIFHARNEAKMRNSVEDRISEARRAGRVG